MLEAKGPRSETRRKSKTTIAEIALADDPQRWKALGFAVHGETMWLGEVRVVLAGRDAGQGILGWSLRGIKDTALDGLPTTISPPSSSATSEPPTEEFPATLEPLTEEFLAISEPLTEEFPATLEPLTEELLSTHPNGVKAIDHVVAMSPDLDRGIDALQAAGLDLRRVRERPTPAGAPRQAFFRLGPTILELIQEPSEIIETKPEGRDGPARFWGLALLTDNIERTASAFAGHCGEVRPAVQYGRWIATVKRSAGLSLPVALMSPAVE